MFKFVYCQVSAPNRETEYLSQGRVRESGHGRHIGSPGSKRQVIKLQNTDNLSNRHETVMLKSHTDTVVQDVRGFLDRHSYRSRRGKNKVGPPCNLFFSLSALTRTHAWALQITVYL